MFCSNLEKQSFFLFVARSFLEESELTEKVVVEGLYQTNQRFSQTKQIPLVSGID